MLSLVNSTGIQNLPLETLAHILKPVYPKHIDLFKSTNASLVALSCVSKVFNKNMQLLSQQLGLPYKEFMELRGQIEDFHQNKKEIVEFIKRNKCSIAYFDPSFYAKHITNAILYTLFKECPHVKHVHLKNNSSIHLPSKCERLESLTISKGNFQIGHIDQLPRSNNLKSLSIEWQAIEKFPKDWSNLTSLNLVHVNLVQLPSGLTNLKSLRAIKLDLKSLPNDLTHLTSLELDGMRSLTTLPDNLTNLTSLRISNSHRITQLPGGLDNLISLDLESLHSLTNLPNNLTNLTSFMIKDCGKIVTFPAFTNLTSLCIEKCEELIILPDDMTNLTLLDLTELKLTQFPKGLTNLTSLRIEQCEKLIALPSDLTNLKVSYIHNYFNRLESPKNTEVSYEDMLKLFRRDH